MKFLLEHLRTHTDLPHSTHDVRELLDEVGIEVKSVDASDAGTVLSVELLANRGDHYCYHGVAREARGRTGAPLHFPKVRKLDVQSAGAATIRIETPLCLVYTLTELTRGDEKGVLPSEVLAPLIATDVHSVNAPVDASNLTNFDIGQPTHAFDAGMIDGAVTVRTSRKGEKAWMLFTPEAVEIPEGTLVIADDSKILGIAGVIGCVESGITDKTRRILLESACFDPVAVRIASRQLNQQTDAAARFMRGGDPTLPIVGAARVAYLLEKYCGYSVGAAYTAGDWKDPRRTIEVDVQKTARFISAPELSHLEMAERLTRYGFSVEVPSPGVAGSQLPVARASSLERDSPGNQQGVAGFQLPVARASSFERDSLGNRQQATGNSDSSGNQQHATGNSDLLVTVPPHRLWDVHFEADLAEEVLKSVGYNATAITLPHVEMGSLPSHEENVLARVDEVFAAEGFYEIFTESFYGRGMRERMGITEGDPLWPHVETQNSIEKNYSLLRNNTVGQALDALARNVDLRNANVKMHEWARIYLPDLSERSILWALANGRDRGPFWGDKGRPADSIFLKGILGQLRLELRVDLQTGKSDRHRLERFFHPGRRAGVLLGERLVGIFGELHPSLVARFDIKRQRPVYFEIETDALFAPPLPRVYTEPPLRQPIVRNVAYGLPRGISAAEVSAILASAAPPFLREIRIVDLFELPPPSSNIRAITFELEFLSDEALTGDGVNAATEAMMAAVKERFGERVTLRA